MSPEDESLSRMVMYVGLGIGLLCVAAALAIQIRMLRKGKATRKDLRDLVMGLLFVAFFAALTMLMQSGKHPGKPPIAVQAVVAAFWTSLVVSLLPEWITAGGEAVRAVAGGWGLRAVVSVIYVAAFVTIAVFAVTYYLPANWLLKAIALFAGCVGGLIWRAVQSARANRPEPPETESPIIRLG